MRRRDNGKRGFPGLVLLLGLLVVLLAWMAFRPRALQPVPQAANTEKNRGATPDRPRSDTSTAPSAPQAERPSAEGDASREKGDNFFRYTDDEGVVHLVDSADSIPEKYRQQVKVYRNENTATQVRIVNNQVLVPVTLRNGGRTVQANLVLDTGCTVTSLSEGLAARLGIDPNRTQEGTARVADGRRVPTRRAVIDEITAGPKAKAPMEVAIMANAGPSEFADGLLGMNFLRDFRYQIDIPGQRIHWR